MNIRHHTLLAVALLAAFPAMAQSNAELLKEVQALRQKTTELEQRLQAAEAQGAELSRITLKTEALEDSREAAGFKQLKIGGYMDPAFIANRAQNTAGFQFLSGVGDDGYNYDNSAFGVVALDLLKETDSGAKFHLTLIPSRGAESIASGANRLLQEASLAVPLDGPTTLLLAGMLPDWSGYEMVQPMPSTAGTGNKLISHNLLYDFTAPASYTGVGLQFATSGWTFKSMLANMNAAKKSAGNKTPVLAVRGDYALNEFSGVGFAGVTGKAANLTQNVSDGNGGYITQSDSRLNLLEVDGYYSRGDLTLQGQIGAGRQKDAAITTDASGALRDASWWGASALVAYKFTPRWENVLRVDYLNNRKNGGGLLGYTSADCRNGIGPAFGAGPGCDGTAAVGSDPDLGANRSAVTLGSSYLLDASTLLKFEVRVDRATLPVFYHVRDGVYRKSNQLIGTSVVVSF